MKRSGFKVMARLVGLVKPLTGYMALAIGMGLVGHMCATMITVFGGYAVLRVLDPERSMALGTIFTAIAIFALVRGILRYAEQACNHFIAFKLLALIRDKVFSALRRLCPAKLEGRDRGDLINVITSDIELLEVFYAHTISPICIAVLFCAGMVAFIGHYHRALGALAALAYITVGGIIPVITSKISGDDGMKFRTKSGELAGFVLDSLRGLSETLQYGQGPRRLMAMNEKTDVLCEDEARMKRTAGRNTAVTQGVILSFDIGMLLLSAHLCDFEGTLIGTIALMSSFGLCVALAALGATLQNTFAAGNRVLDILDESPVVADVTGEPAIDFRGASARHVRFAYEDATILDDFSVEIPENSVIGIVGRSGSGKSTLLKLFMRFWSVQKGEVQLSGRCVSHINTTNLRDMESFVTLNDQTVCVAGFMGGQGSKAKGIGYSEDVSPTIKSVLSGGNTVLDVVYALQGNGIDRAETAGCNGKGWRENECYTLNTIDRPAVVYDAPVAVDGYNQTVSDKMGSLRAGKSDGDHVGILVYDARGNGDGETVATLTGDHQNRVTDYTSVCVMAHGQSNAEVAQDMSPTLNCNHEQPIVAMEGSYKGKGQIAENISPAPKAAHPSDIAYGVDCRNAVLDEEKTHTLQAKPTRKYIVRRLTPLECCRLQGFPDGWADIDRKDDFTDEELDFWRNVRNAHAAINGKQVKEYTKAQMLKWYNGLQTDSSVYKMWGNGIALPCAQYVMEGIALALKGE